MAEKIRPRRGPNRPHRRRDFERMDRAYERLVRQCCATNRADPHAADCQRSTKCRDKLPFSGRDQAQRAAAKYDTGEGVPFTAYRCPDCHQWHVGHDYGSSRDV